MLELMNRHCVKVPYWPHYDTINKIKISFVSLKMFELYDSSCNKIDLSSRNRYTLPFFLSVSDHYTIVMEFGIS